MTETEVIEKIHKLPEPVQRHLYLYVDFLYHAYSRSTVKEEAGMPDAGFFDNYELSKAGKQFLDKRIEQAKAHPEKRTPWREARELIHKKHNLPQ